MNGYDEQANKFLRDTGTSFSVSYLGHYPYFPGEKTPRDVYEIILTRGDQKYTFKFGQSIKDSLKISPLLHKGKWLKRKAPTVYDVLACLTKYPVDTLEDFCSDYGYDEDSRKALEIYLNVQEEWSNVNRLFRDVLDELREIV